MRRNTLIGMLLMALTTISAMGCGSNDWLDRGPTKLAFNGDPEGLYWNAHSQTLYVADQQNNQIQVWRDGNGLEEHAPILLPAPPANGGGLGQLIQLADGTLLVTRFGFGTAGTILTVRPDGGTGTILNLDPARRRVGLAVAPDGTLYETYFQVLADNTRIGAVARFDLSGTETDVVTGLQKPVGVLATATDLFVTDQTQGLMLRCPFNTPGTCTTFATISGPDLLGAGPSGSFFVGDNKGGLNQVSSAAKVTVFQAGFLSARGTAYDAGNRRVFVGDHDPNGKTNFLYIIPVG